MNLVIVFGNDHTNSVGVIQSLGLAGYSSIGLLFGDRTGYVLASKYTQRVISGSDPQTCIDELLKCSFDSKTRIPIVACCDIAALTLEKNAERLKERFVFGYASNHSLDFMAKKENQVKMAAQAGFNVPKSWNLSERKEIPSDVIFPCLIKPLVSCEGAKSDIRVCYTREELERNLNSLNFTKKVLLQQYIDRDYEISILGCGITNGTCLIPVIENKLTLYPKYVGLECLANMQKLTDKEIISNISNLIKSIGYVGLFSVEMMHCKTDGKFYFTEINLRNDGAESFVTKYGANLPLNHVEDLMGLPLTKQKEECPGFYIWDMHHLKSFLCGDISFFTWIKEICRSKGFLMYFPEDKKPFFQQYFYMLKKFFKRKKTLKY